MKRLFSVPIRSRLADQRGLIHQQYRRFEFDGIREAIAVK